MNEETPAEIRVEVPPEFGEVYSTDGERQWVERRHRISVRILQACEGKLFEVLEDEKAFQKLCENMGQVFTDWTIEGDSGPLPKPWQNPKAFVALADSDYELLMWVWNLTFMSVAELLDQKN